MFDLSRTSQAALSILATMLCLALTAFAPKGYEKVNQALMLGVIGFAVLTIVIVVLAWVETGTERVDSIERMIRAYNLLDEEGKAAMYYHFPSMRYRMHHGKVREYWEDTNVTIETFRLFLQDSNQKSIAPERYWNSAERPRWAWEEIRLALESDGQVVADSAAGSHSWLWEEGAYRRLVAYWMAGKRMTGNTEKETA